ncbi:MAG: GNAT family N-acetyltransferase [Pseudomonadota bacterium]
MSRPAHSTIESARLYFVPATVALIQADLDGRHALATALGVDVPAAWPPELFTRLAMLAMQGQLADRSQHGWSTWYLVGRGPGEGVVGVCGFKGRPDAAGSVEISYSILEPFRNAGFASEAVERLSAWAFTHDSCQEVTAETLPHLRQSIRVLEKNGFSRAGQGSEYGVVRFSLARRVLR